MLQLIILATLAAATPTADDFMGYPCTVDCSGHEAGYEWAEDHDITDPDECGSNSQSFVEGCRAYADGEDENEEGDEEST